MDGNPATLFLSPFGGIGSEPFVALQMGLQGCGRRAEGIAISSSLFRNIESANRQTGDLFADAV